jgi:DNA-binding NarL/FixJ family response regulator
VTYFSAPGNTLILLKPSAMKKRKKTVIITDDSMLSVESILCLHSEFDNIQIVSYAGSWKQTLAFVDGIGPDIVLQGIRLPDKDGIGLLGKITESSDVIIVLMIKENNSRNDFCLCKEQGCPAGFSEFNKERSIH